MTTYSERIETKYGVIEIECVSNDVTLPRFKIVRKTPYDVFKKLGTFSLNEARKIKEALTRIIEKI